MCKDNIQKNYKELSHSITEDETQDFQAREARDVTM